MAAGGGPRPRPAAPPGAEKVQTLAGLLPVVAVAPEMRKGQRAREGLASLAIDFDALDRAQRGARWSQRGPVPRRPDPGEVG